MKFELERVLPREDIYAVEFICVEKNSLLALRMTHNEWLAAGRPVTLEADFSHTSGSAVDWPGNRPNAARG